MVALVSNPVLLAGRAMHVYSDITSPVPDKNITARPWLGVHTVIVTPQIAKVLRLDQAKGLLVTDVITESPAEKAGIRGGYVLSNIDGNKIKLGGDIILKVNNKTLVNPRILSDKDKVGETMTLTVLRGEKVMEMNVILDEKHDSFFYNDLSCGSTPASLMTNFTESSNSLADYTMMVYMIGSNLESASAKNIFDLEKVGSSSKVNMLLETGGGDGTIPVDGKSSIDFTKVHRYKILKDNLHTLSNIGQQNMGDPNTLCNFILWGMDTFPAKKYVIILWDHGSGISGFGRDLVFNNDKLTLNELENAFTNASTITNKEFELIGFDSCLMASIEVGNAIQNSGKYLVSSEEVEPSWGWNYSALAKSLIDNPTQNGYSLGKTIATSYQNASNRLADSQGFDAQKTITLSVINLTKIHILIKDLDLLAAHVKGKITDFPSVLSLIRSVESTARYGQSSRSSSGLVDIYDLTSNIKSKFPESAHVVDEIHKIVNDTIVKNVYGTSKLNTHGISIFMPRPTDVEAAANNFDAISSWQDLIVLQQNIMSDDRFPPIVQSESKDNRIRGFVYGNDISNMTLFIHNSNSNLTTYQELDPTSLVRNNGSFEYKWSHQILSLCNEDMCIPTSLNLEISEGNNQALIPVRLESRVSNINETVSLVYEINKQGKFDFLGAWPMMTKEGTVPKQQVSLFPTDIVYPINGHVKFFGYDYKNPTSKLIEGKPVDVTTKFGPRYISYNGTHDLQLKFCDYSNNCGETRTYNFDKLQQTKFKASISATEPEVSNKSIESLKSNITNFASYINPSFGFKMQYPSDWKKEDKGIPDPAVVSISTPDSDGAFLVWADTLPYPKSAKQDSLEYIKAAENDSSKTIGAPFFRLVDSNPVSVDGKPAYKIVYKWLGADRNHFEEMQVRLIMGQKRYIFWFTSFNPSKFNYYLPTVEKMVNSFETKIDTKISGQRQSGGNGVSPNVRSPKIIDKDSQIMLNNFSAYINPSYDFKIQYPSDWKKEQGSSYVSFTATPSHISFSATNQNVLLPKFNLFVQQAPASAQTMLLNYTKNLAAYLKGTISGFNLTELNKINFKGNEASRFSFTSFNIEHRIPTKTTVILSTIGDYLFSFSYVATLQDYNRYLPVIGKIISSFETPTLNYSQVNNFSEYIDSAQGIKISYPNSWIREKN